VDERLGRERRIRSRKDIRLVFARGRSLYRGRVLTVLMVPREGDGRCAVVVGKKSGKAHERNRIKRVTREFYRRCRTLFPGLDLVFQVKARRPVDEALLREDLRETTQRAGDVVRKPMPEHRSTDD